MMRMLLSAIAGIVLLCAPAHAQFGAEASASKAGFSFPATGSIRILVFRPDVSVGAQSTGGMNEPNAEWTKQARDNLATALTAEQAARSNELVMMPEFEGDNAALLADYQALFRNVTNAVVVHKLFKGNRLPTKRADFNWTLGSGVSKLSELGGGDYGLFIYTNDICGRPFGCKQ